MSDDLDPTGEGSRHAGIDRIPIAEREIVIYEGVQFVKGAEGSFGIASCPDDGEVSTHGRANVGARENREPTRAVKAGRRPPGGEALTARSVVVHIL